MAGVVPTTRKTSSGRKQWTLHDGPRCSLKRLRSQLASEGCPESQVVLAKQLLEEQCDLEVQKLENARLGVYWLIKASEQGNIEATDMLKTCLESGRGITEQNYMDVKSCITMTQEEKLARKAAREMFASLSNGEEYITSEQLQRRILELDRSPTKNPRRDLSFGEPSNGELCNHYDDLTSESEEETDWSQRSESSNEKLTEDHLVSAAVNYSNGHLPLVNQILCLQEPNPQALDHIPFIHRPILHPLLALKILYLKVLKFLGNRKQYGYFPVAKTDVQWLSLLCLYVFVSTDEALYFLPLVLYYGSLVVMVVTTFQMLQAKRDFLDFRLWSGLFICYSGGSLDPRQAEQQYIKNNLKPYGHFFLALICNLVIYPVILERAVPQSELSLVAFCLTFMTLLGFMPKNRGKTLPDLLVLLSFAVNVLAKYPYETDPVVAQGWRFLDLKIPTFTSYIIGHGIEFCINFRILLYSFIPILFVRVAHREKWHGTYKFLIPHCVTLSWLQIVIINSQGATMFGLLRGTLALVGVVLFLPLVGLTTVLLPALALTKWVITSNALHALGIFFAFALLGFLICWVMARSRFAGYTAVIQVFFTVTALYFLVASVLKDPVVSGGIPPEKKSISWPQYEKFCHEPAWNGNVAHLQIRCARLDKVPIRWEGYVKEVRIASVTNSKKNLIDKLPFLLSEYFYCWYGDKIEDDCAKSKDLPEEDCRVFKDVVTSNNKCSLEKFDEYQFEIVVTMKTGLWAKGNDIVVRAGDVFRNFTFLLEPEDHVWFNGVLDTRFEKRKYGAIVELFEVGCLQCSNPDANGLKVTSRYDWDFRNILGDVYSGVKSVLNFLFHPIVVFK